MIEPSEAKNTALPLHQILAEEFELLHGSKPGHYNAAVDTADNEKLKAIIQDIHDYNVAATEGNNKKQNAKVEETRERPRAALCLSGGGIRSATFALGILQGLARCGLLDKFHYLSTVSGGGYIGSWLTAWIHHLIEEDKRTEEPDASATARTNQVTKRDGLRSLLSTVFLTPMRMFKSEATQPRPYCAAADMENWDQRREKAIGDMIAALRLLDSNKGSGRKDPIHPEADAIRHLREYSNYLSPKLGFLSADTWTLVASYLRNLILNWLVIIPLLAAILAIPRLSTAIVSSLPPRCLGIWLISLCFAGASCLVWAIRYLGANLPSNRNQALSSDKNDKQWGQRGFLWSCLFVLILAAALLTTFWAWWTQPSAALLKSLPFCSWAYRLGFSPTVFFSSFGLVILVVALALILPFRKPRWIDAIAVVVSGIAGGLLLRIAATKWLCDAHSDPDMYACIATPVFLGAFLLTMTLYIGIASVDIGKPERKITDDDREWWARAGAWVLIAGVVWLIGSALVLFGPRLLQHGWRSLSAIGGVSGLITVLLGGSSKTKASNQDGTDKGGKASVASSLINRVPQVAAPLFTGFLVVLISIGTTGLIRGVILANDQTFPAEAQQIRQAAAKPPEKPMKVSVTAVVESAKSPDTSAVVTAKSKEKIDPSWLPEGPLQHRSIIRHTPWSVALLTICAFGIIGLLGSLFVNVNIFSLHGMYRDRLIRAYLAASRPDHMRKPNPFTGFDPKDNIDMYCLWPQPNREDDSQRSNGVNDETVCESFGASNAARPGPPTTACRRSLFPVINMTLNLVHGRNLAWQERKAESFTVSPLHCGSWAIGTRSPNPKDWKGYRRTDTECPQPDKLSSAKYGYAGGITLGTALTISGAAASPNMGYHSSSLVTFIMTLFNARLGWWLGNPGKPGDRKRSPITKEPYRRWYPMLGIEPIVAEALGFTNDENKYVYLSDGGHFENLGLYEMVLRRCRFIVVSDAGADPECSFVDLGEAIRKIRIDFGIPIDFENMAIYARSDDPAKNKAGRRCAIGHIRYSEVDGTKSEDDGELVYIKPACYGDEPRDIYEYYKRSFLFPHESTLNQFFTESQFESYRMLGYYTMQQLVGNNQVKDFREFVDKIKDHLKPRPVTWFDRLLRHPASF